MVRKKYLFVLLFNTIFLTAMKKNIGEFEDAFYGIQEEYSLEGLESTKVQQHLKELPKIFSLLSEADQIKARKKVEEDRRYPELSNALQKIMPKTKTPAPAPAHPMPSKKNIDAFEEPFHNMQEIYSLEGLESEKVQKILKKLPETFSLLSEADQNKARKIMEDRRYPELSSALEKIMPKALPPSTKKKESNLENKQEMINISTIIQNALDDAIKSGGKIADDIESAIEYFPNDPHNKKADLKLHEQLTKKIQDKYKAYHEHQQKKLKKPLPASKEKSQTIELRARQQGDAVHLWDCSYEVLKNAEYIYKQLKKAGSVNAEGLEKAPYGDWCPKVTEFEKTLEPTSEALEGVINRHRLIPEDTFTFIDLRNMYEAFKNDKAQYEFFKETLPSIGIIKKSPNIVHVFFVNEGAHWITIVVHKLGRDFTYYIADDTSSIRKDKDNYNKAIELIKSLIE